MFERAKKVFERNIKCLSGPQKLLSRPEKYLSAIIKCQRVNLNVFGDIKFIKKFLRYKILNLKCRRNFYPLGQAYITSQYVTYGNEASTEYAYGDICLVVDIPVTGKRLRRKRERG